MQQADYTIFPEYPVRYASFSARLLAYIIDYVLLFIAGLVLHIFLPLYIYGGFFVNLLTQWLYFALQESGPAMATVGKRAMNIKVTGLSGNRITFGQASARYFGQMLSWLILLLGFFMMLWDDKSQTLHDKIAGTLVVVNGDF